MTLRNTTLTAVAALTVALAGGAMAQDNSTAPGVTAPAGSSYQSGAAAPEAAATEATATETAAPEAEATETTAEGVQPEAPAEVETPEQAAAQDTAADAAPAGTVAGDQASEELQADQSADQSEAEEVAQDEAVPAADVEAVETTASEQDAASGVDAETAEEMVDAPETTVSEGETTAAVDEAAAEGEHAAAEGEHAAADAGSHAAAHIEDVAFSFEGPFGKFDQFQLQRGLQVYTEVCAACHGLRYVPIRTLSDPNGVGLPEDQVKAYAANLNPIIDAETGEERPRVVTDHFPTIPHADGMGPDLSLMAKARAGFHGPYGTGISQLVNGIGGPEYIHAVLVGYDGETKEEAGTTLYHNAAFAGNWIQMPQPLMDDQVTYEDGTPATVDQMAQDVAAFLMWTAEPKMMDRKQVGLVSVLFLIVLSALLYLTNKRLWWPIKHRDETH